MVRVATLADIPEIVRVTNAAYRVEDFFIDGDRAYFGMLSVAPAHQKTGLARKLIDAVEARARERGCRILEIDVVNLRTELPAFYDAMGFTATGEAPFLKGHKLKKPVHMVLMEKAL